MDLSFFHHLNVLEAGKVFFKEVLNLNIAPVSKSGISIKDFLKEYLTDERLLDKVSDARFIGFLNDLSIKGKEQKDNIDDFLTNPTEDYDMLLVFGIQLKDGIIPTRSDIIRLTRALNRRSASRPVVLLTTYSDNFSFSAAERGQYKRRTHKGEKVGRISILRDINFTNVHAGHERILIQLRSNLLVGNSFKELYNQWLDVFNISLLNKEFYNELFTWYLWAIRTVSFPNKVEGEKDDTTFNSENVIRLLTRLIFVWFVKEKKLIPDTLFDKQFLMVVLKNFNPLDDKNSDYYKAILQNLFFATLNTEMSKDGGLREFLDENKKKQNSGYSEQYMDHLSYRYKDLFTDPDIAMKLFEDIPFLNGGLFECLDHRDPETNIEIRIDGFSSKPSKQPKIPNFLFFGTNDDLDLSNEFEDGKKHKHSKVRGIINILNNYKFTIEENTPLEQEIALDPELLGKIFENLLASFNPETKTTVRKQTGSYYTPREIVNYMVDESLIAYLKTNLTEKSGYQELGIKQTDMFGNEGKKGQLSIHVELASGKWKENVEELETKLRSLLNYENEDNPFEGDIETTNAIIAHLSECKILDPACGSGAFPMGILHKMVFALGKLDPCNLSWKMAQLEKVQRDKERAKSFEDDSLREAALINSEEKEKFVKASFGETGHELDYARKLFLIENCIYGVDIQQIAIQISKLRFFISLMVDQRVDDMKPNRNILSLPNLETKFVAANTLIPIDKPQQLVIKDPELNKIEKDLHRVHQQIFFTRSYSEKKNLKILELETRKQLRKLYIDKAGYSPKAAELITCWNPFDPLKSAPFFDPEVMFTIEKHSREGFFDIVLGNPPYGNINKKQNKAESITVSAVDYKFYKENPYYEPATGGMINIFRLFILRSIYLLKPSAVFSEIFPLAFIGDLSVMKLRKHILKNNTILSIEAFPERDNPSKRVFEPVKMSVCILTLLNKKSNSDFFLRINKDKYIDITNEKTYLNLDKIKLLDNSLFTIPLCTKKELDLLSKIYLKSINVKEIGHCVTGEADMTFCKNLFTNNPSDAVLLKGAIIDRYYLRSKMSQGEIVFLNEQEFLLKRKGIKQQFKNTRRIVLQGITGINESVRLKMTIIENAYCANSINFLSFFKPTDIYLILGILNSKMLNFIFSKFSTNSNVNGYEIDNLPLMKDIPSNYISIIHKKVEHILKSKIEGKYSLAEHQIDFILYKIYNLTFHECKIIDPDFEKLISPNLYDNLTPEELAKYEII